MPREATRKKTPRCSGWSTTKMKVILLQDVRGVGRKHEIKNVADGYAMNLLLPRKLAEAATESKIAALQALQEKREAEARQEEVQLTKKIESLSAKEITLAARATPQGGLFKAITTKDISRAILEQHSLEIPESVIELDAPIKTVGIHEMRLRHARLKLNITSL